MEGMMEPFLKSPTTIIALFILLFLSGCGTANVSFLTRDNLEKDQSIILFRLKCKDPTWSLGSYGAPDLILHLEGEDGKEYRKWLHAQTGDKRVVWKKENAVYYIDQYYYLTVNPGRYFIKYISFSLGSSTERVYQGTKTYYYSLDVPLNIAMDVNQGEFISLGAIDFQTTDVEANKRTHSYSFDYTIKIDDTPAQMEMIENHFQTRFPQLGQMYSNDRMANRPYYGLYSNFANQSEVDRWPALSTKNCKISIRKEGKLALILDGRYTDKIKHGYSSMKEPLILPNNYTINYKMRWLDGMNDAVYGLLIWQDEKNIYYVGATAQGIPTVWIKKDGQWKGQPQINKPSKFMSSATQPDDFLLEFNNGEITYKLNNEVVSSFKAVLGNNKSKVGFFVSGTQKVAVDSIMITGQ